MESNLPLCLPQAHDSYLPAMPLLSGEIYRYTNKSEAVPSETEWSYIGATEKPKGREGQWDSPSSNYAGSKIAKARKSIPLKEWKRYSFPVFDTDPERLKQRLKEYETYYIAYFNSYECGYNGNRGGRGIAAWVLFRVTDTSGTQNTVRSYDAVSKLSGVPIGSINYVAKKDDHLAKNGVKIERLN